LANRARQSFCPILQLLEQPHILDRDDSLVGEGLQQSDVALAEGTDFGPRDDDCTTGLAIAQHRH
jgi:hypothetical protein